MSDPKEIRETLLDLDRLDRELQGSGKAANDAKANCQRIDAEIKRQQTSRSAVQDEIRRQQLREKEIEAELTQLAADHSRVEQNRRETKSVATYEALNRELALCVEKQGELEDEGLNILENLEIIEKQLAHLDDLCHRLDSQRTEAGANLEKVEDEVKRELASLKEEHHSTLERLHALDQDMGEAYVSLAAELGTPIAWAEGGFCRSCNNQLTPGTQQAASKQIVSRCNGCGRFLVGVRGE